MPSTVLLLLLLQQHKNLVTTHEREAGDYTRAYKFCRSYGIRRGVSDGGDRWTTEYLASFHRTMAVVARRRGWVNGVGDAAGYACVRAQLHFNGRRSRNEINSGN